MKPEILRNPRLRKFHIGTGQSHQEIIDQFVVRGTELNAILEILHENTKAVSCQHVLVVAPRGRGKTTLLVRVIAELRTKELYSDRLLPVRLMEESHEVFTLADFWLECLYYLSKACAEIDHDLANELDASHAVLKRDWTNPALEGRARATVLDAADRLGRKLVVMVENLQALCQDADTDFGWDLRQVLQTEPQVMLLATATSRFAGLDDAKEPFFELFRTICLAPLDTAECRQLWQAITGEAVDEHRIRPLRILTGGSPRLMVLLADFNRDRSLRQLMDQLVELIDDHTEYFRGHIEDLPAAERRVYVALIDLWQASTSSEIASRARMDIRKVSALLGRLVDRGIVVPDGSARKKTYYPAERLYSIYYKLRRERDEAAVVQNLIHFMVTYYEGHELADLLQRMMTEASESAGIREGLARVVLDGRELRRLVENQSITFPEPFFNDGEWATLDGLGQIRVRFESGDFEGVIQSVNEYLSHPKFRDSSVAPTVIFDALTWKGIAQSLTGNQVEAAQTFAFVVERFGESQDPQLQVRVAGVLFNQGIVQELAGNAVAAMDTFARMLTRFRDSEDPKLRTLVATTLLKQGIMQWQIGDEEGAIGTFASAVGYADGSEDPELLIPIVRAWLMQGLAQRIRNGPAAAIDIFRSLVEHFGNSEHPELKVQVAKALMFLGMAQRELGEAVAEAEAYADVVRRFRASKDPQLQILVTKALLNWGIVQHRSGDRTGAMETYASVVERFCESEEPELLVQIARALVETGVAKGELGDQAGAMETFASVLARFGESEDQELLVQVARALVETGVAKGELGDQEGALETYASVLARFGESEEPELLVQVARALVEHGSTLEQSGDQQGAMKAFAAVLKRFDNSQDPAMIVQVALAMFGMASIDDQRGDRASALNLYNLIIDRFGKFKERYLQIVVGHTMGNAVEILCQIGDVKGALGKVKQLHDFAENKGLRSLNLRASWAEAMAHALIGNMDVVGGRLRGIYSSLDVDDRDMLKIFQKNVSQLVAFGAVPKVLADILGEDEKEESLRPLSVALRLEAGETVRAPTEILEVAADIRKEIEEKRRNRVG